MTDKTKPTSLMEHLADTVSISPDFLEKPIFPLEITVRNDGKAGKVTLLADGSFEGDTTVFEEYLAQATPIHMTNENAILMWSLVRTVKQQEQANND